MRKIVVAVLLVAVAGFGFAQDFSVPHEFTDGETVSAQEFNENFSAIEDELSLGEWVSPTLNTGWTTYNLLVNTDVFQDPEYRLDGAGIVHLRGLPNRQTGTNTAFTLPVGLRPAKRLLFGVSAQANQATTLYVDADGDVEWYGMGWVSLDGVYFVAEQ